MTAESRRVSRPISRRVLLENACRSLDLPSAKLQGLGSSSTLERKQHSDWSEPLESLHLLRQLISGEIDAARKRQLFDELQRLGGMSHEHLASIKAGVSPASSADDWTPACRTSSLARGMRRVLTKRPTKEAVEQMRLPVVNLGALSQQELEKDVPDVDAIPMPPSTRGGWCPSTSAILSQQELEKALQDVDAIAPSSATAYCTSGEGVPAPGAQCLRWKLRQALLARATEGSETSLNGPLVQCDDGPVRPLFAAIFLCETEALSALLEAKADPTLPYVDGLSPLQVACGAAAGGAGGGYAEIIRLLIDAGTDVNASW